MRARSWCSTTTRARPRITPPIADLATLMQSDAGLMLELGPGAFDPGPALARPDPSLVAPPAVPLPIMPRGDTKPSGYSVELNVGATDPATQLRLIV